MDLALTNRRGHTIRRHVIDNGNTIAYLLVLIALFGGVLFWAFGRKRKKRFDEDAKIPFKE
jgi:cbb3-type cytochrome oxidase subunit 3